jgi:EmrB/QacA subfamily drug resistance transporter
MHGRSAHRTESGTRRPWSILILLSIAQFMVILDVTVVNVALPSIGEALDFPASDLQWVVTAYVLFTGGFLLLGGGAADLVGRRQVFLTGLSIFTLASLASGLAPTATALVVSRAAQGLGAALLTPGALSIITATYVGPQRAAALTVWGAIGGAGAAAGVVIGGLLTSWLGWESVFFINVPIGVAVGLLTLHLVPATRPRAPRGRLDLPGALAVVAGLVLLVYAIQGTDDYGWRSARTWVPLGLAGGLLAAFGVIERRVSRPLVPPATWSVHSLVAGVGLMFAATGLLIATFFLNSLYLQHILGASALETGLAFLPLTLVIAAGAHVASRLIGRVGARALAVAGLGLMGVAAFLIAAAPDEASYRADLLPGFLVLGLGVGFVFPAASITTMSEVRDEGAGLASGLMTTGHEIGAALGVAVFSAVATAASTLAAGYGKGFFVMGLLALALAAAALVAMPGVRPTGEAPIAAH